MKYNQILLIRSDSGSESVTVHAIKKHNVSNESVSECNYYDFLGQIADETQRTQVMQWPSLILLDCGTNCHGDLIAKVRSTAETKTIPAVALINEHTAQQISSIYRAGANSVIRKPTNPDELSDVLMNAVMYWTLLNEYPA